MGVAWGDYDGDGRWDLHVSDYWTPYRWILNDSRWPMPPLPGAGLVRPHMANVMRRRSRGDALFRNLGGLKFERTSEAAGVADGGWAWGTEFVDLDGKGREDLLVVNGMFRATTGVDDEISFWNAMGREGVNFHDGIWGGIDFGVNGMASRDAEEALLEPRRRHVRGARVRGRVRHARGHARPRVRRPRWRRRAGSRRLVLPRSAARSIATGGGAAPGASSSGFPPTTG